MTTDLIATISCFALMAPAALVALSGGSYTENQNSISEKLSALPTRAFFAYPAGEASWNEGIAAIASTWEFVEYAPGAHGTGLITSNPEIHEALEGFLAP